MAYDEIRGKVEIFVKELANASRIRGIYGPEHNLTKGAVNNLFSMLKEIFSKEGEVVIGVIGNEMAFKKEPFYEASKYIRTFLDYLKEIGAEKITFKRGLTINDLTSAINILGMSARAIKDSGGLKKLVNSVHLAGISFGKIGVAGGAPRFAETSSDAVSRQNFQNGVYFLQKASEDMAANRRLDLNAARSFTNNLIGNLLENKYSLLVLTSVKAHDEYSFIHSLNVAILTLAQALSLELDQIYLNDIGVAALFHDVGKVTIPGDILRKKDKLSEEDFEQIHAHSAGGAKILMQTPDINPIAAMAAFEHHIKYDMSGYPKKVFGGNINLISMMIEIADFYDATRSKRTYRDGMPVETVYEEMMKLSGTSFHPVLLRNFFRVVGIYSPGSLVELDDKTIGLVIKESALDMRRPQIEILYDSKGGKVEEPYMINLLEKDKKTQQYKRTIVRSINPSDKFKIPEKYQ